MFQESFIWERKNRMILFDSQLSQININIISWKLWWAKTRSWGWNLRETRSQNEIHRFTHLTLIHFYSMSRLFYTMTWLIDDTRWRKGRIRKRRSRIIVGGGSESGIRRAKEVKWRGRKWTASYGDTFFPFFLLHPSMILHRQEEGYFSLKLSFFDIPLFNWFIDRDHGKDRKRRKGRKKRR